jgi:hypothetical protein
MELLETKSNPLKIYRQAKKILKSTSRAKNADWYKRAHDLQLQWHLWVGSSEVVSAIYSGSTNQWFEGPAIPAISFDVDENNIPTGLDDHSRNQLHELLRQILGSKHFGGKPKSLGVVFHLADALRVRDLAPEFAADNNFEALDTLLASDPGIALGDDSVAPEDGFWHIFPLLGNKDSDKLSVAVQVSSQYKFMVDELKGYGELRNIPVITEVLSAALEGVASLPLLIPERGSFATTISLIQFEAFTLLCANGKKGEILMLRPLPHRSGTTLSPNEYSDLIANTAALLDLKDPDIVAVSMSGIPSTEHRELFTIYLEQNPDAKLHVVNAKDNEAVENIPSGRFEFAFITGDWKSKNLPDIPLLQAKDKWAIQDFCGESPEEIAKMPSRGDLRLLKFSSMGQKVAVVALLIFAGWTGTDFITKMSTEAWKLPPTAAQEMQAKMAKLQKEKAEYEHWNGLLAKRSEGWAALQTILSIFPDNGGVILSSASYRAVPGEMEDEKVGFGREWTVSGYANPKVATKLASLGSRSYVEGLLNQIAEETQADYLRVDGESREVNVNFQQKQGTMPPTKNFPAKIARHFRIAFELGIRQTHSPADELAMTSTPAEKK